MNNTPRANRTHIAIYGKRNAGKSSLFNAILGQNISIISSEKGTTTDPVNKAMELIPYGPVVFIDTAGLDDTGNLGSLRVEKAKQILARTDFALYVIDGTHPHDNDYIKMKKQFDKFKIPHLIVINKSDVLNKSDIENINSLYDDGIFVSTQTGKNIIELKNILVDKLKECEEPPTILGDILPYNSSVVLVVPIDSEAPKGRLILPQVQVIRDCLDNGIKCYVVRDTELESALKDLKSIDLVITDSQAFKSVNKIVPKNIPLSSFSILFARHKGDLNSFIRGTKQIDLLEDNSKILITESCTHNISHEDIGRVKIPNLLSKYTGKKLKFEFSMGHDFPVNLKEYDLIIHCGACMLNPKTVKNRILLCEEVNTPITNYGMVIAKVTGILDRSIEIFK